MEETQQPWFAAVLLGCAVLLPIHPAQAQNYLGRGIHFIAPIPAGGSIGRTFVARVRNHGYTIMLVNSGQVINPLLSKEFRYAV